MKAESPLEQLKWLEQSPGAWADFLAAHDGSVTLAGYTLAVLKNEARGRGIPTAVEVHVGAREVVERCQSGEFVPGPAALKSMAEAYGLPVI